MTAADAGHALQRLREAAGVSIADLAEASDYSPGWLRSLERGTRTRAATLTAVGEALGRLRNLDDEQTDELVAGLLAAADGDLKPDGPPGTPARDRDPDRHRRQVADERARDRRRQRREEDPDELVARALGLVDADPPSPWANAADLLEQDDEGADDGR